MTGRLAGQVGGVAWLPFLVAFGVATLTAFSYLELVTKYPQAAGAALYTHKASGVHFVTFLVAFTVVCSGITSASTSSGLLASNLLIGREEIAPGVPTGEGATLVVALLFMPLLAAVNLRGVGESVKFNVVLTIVEMAALAIVIGIGGYVIAQDEGNLSRITVFESPGDRNLFAAVTIATAIAFFSRVGFEDSVNMVEETKEPAKVFPKMMLTGLGIAVVVSMLVAVSVVAVIPAGKIADPTNPGAGILLDVVKIGAPGIPIDSVFPFLTVFAVANTTVLALALILVVRLQAESTIVAALSGTTSLLLLAVFAVVNVACLVLRRDPKGSFTAPKLVPVVGALACLYLLGPWARLEEDFVQYKIAAGLMGLGVVLWALTWLANRSLRAERTGFRDIEHLDA